MFWHGACHQEACGECTLTRLQPAEWHTTRDRFFLSPIVGRSATLKGYVHAEGMCGQGYMLGPGVGALLARLVTDALKPGDEEILAELSPARKFGAVEALK